MVFLVSRGGLESLEMQVSGDSLRCDILKVLCSMKMYVEIVFLETFQIQMNYYKLFYSGVCPETN